MQHFDSHRRKQIQKDCLLNLVFGWQLAHSPQGFPSFIERKTFRYTFLKRKKHSNIEKESARTPIWAKLDDDYSKSYESITDDKMFINTHKKKSAIKQASINTVLNQLLTIYNIKGRCHCDKMMRAKFILPSHLPTSCWGLQSFYS